MYVAAVSATTLCVGAPPSAQRRQAEETTALFRTGRQVGDEGRHQRQRLQSQALDLPDAADRAQQEFEHQRQHHAEPETTRED